MGKWSGGLSCLRKMEGGENSSHRGKDAGELATLRRIKGEPRVPGRIKGSNSALKK